MLRKFIKLMKHIELWRKKTHRKTDSCFWKIHMCRVNRKPSFAYVKTKARVSCTFVFAALIVYIVNHVRVGSNWTNWVNGVGLCRSLRKVFHLFIDFQLTCALRLICELLLHTCIRRPSIRQHFQRLLL